MPSAYVLINTQSGLEENVLKQLRSINGVSEAYLSFGVYDLIIKVTANSMDELRDIICHKIRSLEKVLSTLTLMLLDE